MEDEEIRGIIFTFALVMVVIIMIASISLIYNAFAISVSERIKQLGMIASVGATNKQKRENVYFEGFVVGSIGIPLGIIAGITGIGITIKFVSGIINESLNSDYVHLQMVVSPTTIILTVLFAILTIFISVYVPAKRASKIMPIEAIRQSMEVKMTSKNVKTSKLTAIGDEAFEKYVASIGGNIADYNDPSNPCGILVNRTVSYLPEEKKYVETEALKIKEGDSIPFGYVKDIEGETSTYGNVDLKIKNTTDEMPIGTYTNQFGQLKVITSDTIFDSIVKTQNKYYPNPMLALKTSDGAKLDTQIQQVFKDNGISDGSEVIMFNTAINAKQQKRISLVMGVFIYGFITLISLICIANIFNTVSTNIALRRKEFAMLRSVGMTPKSFNKMMNFESAFYGIKALLYGLPISGAIGYFLYLVLNDTISFTFSLPLKDYGIAIVFVFVIVSATMLYFGSKIRKQNIIDALKDDSY